MLYTEGGTDGVFIDNLWGLQPCYCELCQKSFKNEIAISIFGDLSKMFILLVYPE